MAHHYIPKKTLDKTIKYLQLLPLTDEIYTAIETLRMVKERNKDNQKNTFIMEVDAEFWNKYCLNCKLKNELNENR